MSVTVQSAMQSITKHITVLNIIKCYRLQIDSVYDKTGKGRNNI